MVPSKKSKTMPGELLHMFFVPEVQFYCLAENIAKLTAVSELLCCNAADVTDTVNVYCIFTDI